MLMLTTSATENNQQPVHLDKGEGSIDDRGVRRSLQPPSFPSRVGEQSKVAKWQVFDTLRGGIITAS